MLGLNGGRAFRSWVLLAELKDASFLRNASALFLANEMMDEHIYVSDFRHVELYINDTYWGVYLLAEQQQMNTGRALNQEDAIGSYAQTDIPYFFEMAANAANAHKEGNTDRYFTLSYKNTTTIANTAASKQGNRFYRIRSEIANPLTNPVHRNFLQTMVQNIYDTCYDATYNGIFPAGKTNAKEAIESVVDLDSLVNMYLLCDIVCDFDLDYASFFFSLDMRADGNKLLTFDAPWDFDVSQGLFNPNTNVRYAGGDWGTYSYTNTSGDPGRAWVNSWRGNQNAWFMLVAKEAWFQELVAAKWKSLVSSGAIERLTEYQNSVTNRYTEQFAKNFERWAISPHVEHFMTVAEVDACKSQLDGITYLQSWQKARFSSLNEVYI